MAAFRGHGAFAAGIPQADIGDFLDVVTQALAPRLLGPDGRWVVDYQRLRFAARLP